MRTMPFDVLIPEGTKVITQDDNGEYYAYGSTNVVFSEEGGGFWYGTEDMDMTYLCTGAPPEDASQEYYEVENYDEVL